ncbi:hypothetical protein H4217_003183 [Coemansia sp. RSA 1939]|nr:hypothetical protein H4217_003183 [Coemansia sp. RSA 1939]KAJ2613747.1 hypothetical protein EV177_002396 [Coemansia sp. RSA 1804]
MAGQTDASTTPAEVKSARINMVESTPKSQLERLTASASLKRVHFSPRNEEFYNGMVPQSSPTRAQKRPRSRGILKHAAIQADNRSSQLNQQQQQQQLIPSSDIDGCDQFNQYELFDQLSSPLDSADVSGMPRILSDKHSSAARVLFSAGAVLENVADNQQSNAIVVPSGQLFKEAVERLREIVPTDADASRHIYKAYSDIYTVLADTSGETALSPIDGYSEHINGLLGCLDRDVGRVNKESRGAVLTAIKCLGYLAHMDKLSSVPESGSKLAALLKTMCATASREYADDKAVCMAVISCICLQRVPVPPIHSAVAAMISFCVDAMRTFDRSVTLVFQCLTAIETLLRRAPATTRGLAHIWLFPVLFHIVSTTPGVRAKADDIVRQNMPWVSADAHGQEMEKSVAVFLESQLDGFVGLCERLLDRGDCHIVARIWGMLVTVCARQCRARMSGMLHIMQKCFNSDDTRVLVAALMQWRCLIYAFLVQGQLGRLKCVKLVMTPILALLAANSRASSEVRLASVRCWATLVYALGEGIDAHMDIVTSVAAATAGDQCIEVREVVARVLASLMNQMVLPEEKIARFVIPKMIIGTTTLAAADGKALSTTRGPFSSDSVYSGDHTETLCRYVVGISANSPVLSALTDAIMSFVKQYVCNPVRGETGSNSGSDPLRFGALSQLCNTVLRDPKWRNDIPLANVFFHFTGIGKRPAIPLLDELDLHAFISSPLSVLYDSLVSNEPGSLLAAVKPDMCPVTWVSSLQVLSYLEAIPAVYIRILLSKLLGSSSIPTESTVSATHECIRRCTQLVLDSSTHVDPIPMPRGLCIMFDIIEGLLLYLDLSSKTQVALVTDTLNLMMNPITKHVGDISGSNEVRLAFCSSHRKLYGCGKFWVSALTSVKEWVKEGAAVDWNLVEVVLALCYGQKVYVGEEPDEICCKELLRIIAGLALAIAQDDPEGSTNDRSITPSDADTCIDEIQSRGISALLAHCSDKKVLERLNSHRIAQLVNIFSAIVSLLCLSSTAPLADRHFFSESVKCVPFGGDVESVDMLLQRSSRICEDTKDEGAKTELSMAVVALTILDQLRSSVQGETSIVSRSIELNIDASEENDLANIAAAETVLEDLAVLSEDEDVASITSPSKRSSPEDNPKSEDPSEIQSVSRPGAEEATLQRLYGFLEQLEQGLCDTNEIGLDGLLAVQERIFGIQQRLCVSMKAKQHIVNSSRLPFADDDPLRTDTTGTGFDK